MHHTERNVTMPSLPKLNPHTPSQVVKQAMAKIDANGEIQHIEESGVVHLTALRPIELRRLPQDTFLDHLLTVARSIAQTCKYRYELSAGWQLASQGWSGATLAQFLTAYTHEPRFISEALTLVRIDENGMLHEPHLDNSYVSPFFQSTQSELIEKRTLTQAI